jgi:uncharacterized MAPEG superfamily protein
MKRHSKRPICRTSSANERAFRESWTFFAAAKMVLMITGSEVRPEVLR